MIDTNIKINVNDLNKSINILNIPRTIYNVLRDNNIETISQIFDSDVNMNALLSEDKSAYSKLLYGLECLSQPIVLCNSQYITLYQYIFDELNNIKDASLLKFKVNNTLYDDIQVYNVVTLSTRIINIAQRLSVNTLKSLLAIDLDKLSNFPNFGKNSLNELIDFFKEVCVTEQIVTSDNIINLDEESQYLNSVIKSYYDELGKFNTYNAFKIIMMEYKDLFIANKSDESLLLNKKVNSKIYTNEFIIDILKKLIADILIQYPEGLTRFKLINKLPRSFINSNNFIELFNKICNDSTNITYFNDKYLYKFESILSFLNRSKIVKNIPTDPNNNERAKEIIIESFCGKTYRDLAKKYNVSFQRIGQLVKKALSKRPPVFEDRFAYWYNNYSINSIDFCELFDTPLYVYNYLKAISDTRESDKKDFKDLLNDPLLDENFYKKIYDKVYTQRLQITNNTTLKDNWDLFLKANKSKYQFVPTSVDTLYKDYTKYCKDTNTTNLIRSKRGLESKISLHDKRMILCRKRLYRYYEIDDNKLLQLFKSFNLENYKGKCISSLRLFIDYKDLMDSYDIRSEYELYSLFRTYSKLITWCNISFSKMPLMNIGIVNRKVQIFNEFKKIAPCSRTQLVDKMYELYGIDKITSIQSWLDLLSSYYYNGVYSFDNVTINKSLGVVKTRYLTEALTNSYFTVSSKEDDTYSNAVKFVKDHFRHHSKYFNYYVNTQNNKIFYISDEDVYVCEVPVFFVKKIHTNYVRIFYNDHSVHKITLASFLKSI